MKFLIYTLGCKVNQNESDAMHQLLLQAGYTAATKGDTADIYIVNSCTVTAGGDSKSRQWLRSKKRNYPKAIAVLAGCFPQAFPKNAVLPEADIIMGTSNRKNLVNNILRFLSEQKQIIDIVPHSKKEPFEELPQEIPQERTRAFIKVEDGCNRRCAYCIIPTARGPVRSRIEESILAELTSLAANGYKEIVFSGINLPSYGLDTTTDLGALVTHAAARTGIERIRLSSLDPDLITEEQIAIFATTPKFCRHFHLSLQSGSNKVLRDMRRPYTTEKYYNVVELIRQYMPNSSFTTDIIVGFPGETEEDFLATISFVRKIDFLKVHVFPFSARPGTPAADFTNQIEKSIKTQRARILQQESNKVRTQYIQRQLHKHHEILLEKPVEKNIFTGYTKTYIPINFKTDKYKHGDIANVVLAGFDGQTCTCTE